MVQPEEGISLRQHLKVELVQRLKEKLKLNYNRCSRTFSLLLILNVAATYGQTSVPQWQWAQAAKGLGHEFAYEVDVDAKGNSVFCGEFQTPSCQFGSTTLQAPLTYNYNFS
ncbi:MAG: hypothetical protein HWD58_04285 [Bacteroidota bacterium]|nr:MAG: hypothetical protein HWD58_04285 [Bacteroidota bacterium]